MSVRSCFTLDKQEMDQQISRETVSETDDREAVVRRSSRLRLLNTRRNPEEDIAERANALFRSRAGHISNLTRIQSDIEAIMYACEEKNEVVLRKTKYDEAWRKFIDAHERYVECITSKEEKEKALLSYERQKIRKLYFDDEVMMWCENLEKEASRNVPEHISNQPQRSKRSKPSMTSASQRSSAVSKKQETLALAQLKVSQLEKQHQLERKMTELKFEKEMMEARMEEERAAVSLIYEQNIDEEKKLDHHGDSEYKDMPNDVNNLKVKGKKSVTDVQQLRTSSFQPLQLSQQPAPTLWPQPSQRLQKTTTTSLPQMSQLPQSQARPDILHESRTINTGEEVVRALRQIVSTPKIEYIHFDGDPVNYVSFLHNFETCLERDNPDCSRRLQLLIQHCTGKAREAIESCVNLPEEEGYQAAKDTLRENFGRSHIIAKAHIKKLENLVPLKLVDGQSLLKFARHLEVAKRTLAGMGSEYTEERRMDGESRRDYRKRIETTVSRFSSVC